MRLVTFKSAAGDHRLGALLPGDRVLDFRMASDGAPEFASMLALIEAGPAAWERARGLASKPAAKCVLGAATLVLLGPAKGKDFDGANAFGPCILTADEITDPYDLPMIARVNGVERSRGNSREMHWRFEDVIAYVSQGETQRPGEILASGTVGDGCGLEQLRFLDDCDRVELEIPPIGVLANRVVRGAPAAAP